MALNNVPGLIPLKIYSGSTLLTSNLNLITFTGSGVTTTIGNFNNLTVNITSGGGTTTVIKEKTVEKPAAPAPKQEKSESEDAPW